MNEIFSNAKLSLERLITLLIPGSIAAMPYFWLAYKKVQAVHAFIDSKEGLAAAMLVIVAVAAGLLLEDLGSRLEVWLDERNKPTDFDGVWEAYLKLDVDRCRSIVAQGYLRSLLMRMKFELSIAWAILFSALGVHVMHMKAGFMAAGGLWWYLVGYVVPLALLFYFIWEAYSSGKNLHKNRVRVLAALGVND